MASGVLHFVYDVNIKNNNIWFTVFEIKLEEVIIRHCCC